MDHPPTLSEARESCLNCGEPLTGNYCGNCGQEAKELRRPFFRLSSEAIQSLFELDGRAFRTLFYLLTKPAHLSNEHFSGRRARYTPPLRLFLVISVSFFLLVGFYTSIRSIENVLNANGEESSEEVTASINDELNFIIEGDPDDDGDEAEDGLAAILLFVEGINLPFFDEQTNANLRSAMSAQAETNLKAMIEDPGEFARGYLEYITFFILLMIPLLALIQKLIYIRSGRFYVEHLVLTLHNHAFLILIIFIESLLNLIEESQIPIISSLFGYLGAAIYIWLWTYLFLSLKYITTTLFYGLTLSLGILLFAGILFFLL